MESKFRAMAEKKGFLLFLLKVIFYLSLPHTMKLLIIAYPVIKIIVVCGVLV